MALTTIASEPRRRIYFANPKAFWAGSTAVVVGVLFHVPMFVGARDSGYRLVGMPLSGPMILGMALIVGGFVSVYFGLAPKVAHRASESHIQVKAFDDAPLRPAHYRLMAVLLIAIAVDTLKPFTFVFIIPGATAEYGLSSPGHLLAGHWPIALYPLSGITGTAIGSFLWGYLGDRIGRRASVLFGAIIFIGTSICGFMVAYGWNLVMCFIMGLGVGGLLPIAYSLLTETIPARNRGTIVVLVAGVGTALGFLLASNAADWLIPHYTWRIMWLLGLPTGVLLILLNRWIPESPRFLLANGRDDEARECMAEFGVEVVESSELSEEAVIGHELLGRGFTTVFRPPFGAITLALILYGLGWGLVNFGFITWLPAKLAAEGLATTHVTSILAHAALFAVPGSVLVAWLYGRWSAKWTMALVAGVSAVVLLLFATEAHRLASNQTLLTVLIVALLVPLWGVVSVLAPYAAEVYPTAVRATGSGVAAGASKIGGVIALGMSAAAIAPPGIAGAAFLTGVPMALAAVAVALVGIETRGKSLETISLQELEFEPT